LLYTAKNKEDKCGWQLGALYLSAFASGQAVYKVGTRYSILPIRVKDTFVNKDMMWLNSALATTAVNSGGIG